MQVQSIYYGLVYQYNVMLIIEMISYIFSGSICLVIGIFLLAIRTPRRKCIGNYLRLKRFLAYAAFVDVFNDICILYMAFNHQNFFLLDLFLIPLTYYVEIAIVTFALLSLLHSHRVTWRNAIWLNTPLVLLILVYLAGYIWSGCAGYISFAKTTFSIQICYILYVVVLVDVCILAYWLLAETKVFMRRMTWFFSGRQVMLADHLRWGIYAYLTYLVLAASDFIMSCPLVDTIMMFVNTVVFALGAIIVFNLQGTYLILSPAIEYSDEQNLLEDMDVSDLQDDEGTNHIEDLVNKWKQTPNKPYLKEGLNIAMVAEQIGVNSRVLSEYLNKVCNVTFNTWINKMRMDEAKSILEYNDNISMEELAQKVGINSASAMTQIFKRFHGVTPSVLRKRASTYAKRN